MDTKLVTMKRIEIRARQARSSPRPDLDLGFEDKKTISWIAALFSAYHCPEQKTSEFDDS